jgi:tRNA-dihydrouridine synthase
MTSISSVIKPLPIISLPIPFAKPNLQKVFSLHMNQLSLFYLAPLRGITDYLFRNTFETYFGKFDYLLTPFIPTLKGTIANTSHCRDITPAYNDTKRVIPQIIGNDSKDIAALANHMVDLGYHTVNLNLGCPHPQITRKKRGAGLLPYPDIINSLLESVFSNIKCSFSVKLRLGLESPNELEKIIPILNKFPLSEVIVHPRTGSQMYSGSVDLNFFSLYANLIKAPVTYNGDLWSLWHFERYASQFTDVNRWMLGRGVVADPFILEEFKTRKLVFRDVERLKCFHDELFEKNIERLCGPSHLLGKMKEFWGYLANSFDNSKKVLKKIQKKTSINEYCKLTKEIFSTESIKQPSQSSSLVKSTF